jgi:type II secretory pathway pseudopilin PulG
MDFASVAVVVVVIGIAVVLARAGYRSSLITQQQEQAVLQKEMEAAQATIDRMQAVEGDFSKLPDLTKQVHNLVLHANEKCFAICRGTQHVVEARLIDPNKSSTPKERPLSLSSTFRKGGAPHQPIEASAVSGYRHPGRG